MPAEVGQKEVDSSVSPDEFKLIKRKANIAYFAAKNDIKEVTKFSRSSYERRKFEFRERYCIFIYQYLKMVVGTLYIHM